METELKNICVYCGSSPGKADGYRAAAVKLGKLLAERAIGVVYGGASVGLMGSVARAALSAGGRVVGVIPEVIADQEIALMELEALHVVKGMHERKALMAELSDGFISLPGGFGTLDEMFEMLTWAQLGIHVKPVGLLNVNHYYDHLFAFLDHAVEEQFIFGLHRQMIQFAEDPETLLEKMVHDHRVVPNKSHWVRNMSAGSG